MNVKERLANTIDRLQKLNKEFEIRNAEVTNIKYPVFKLAGMRIRKYSMFMQDGIIYILIHKA